MAAPLPLLILALACGPARHVRWASPAFVMEAPPPTARPAPADLQRALREGVRVPVDTANTLFPEVGFNPGFVRTVEIRADGAWTLGPRLVLERPRLRCLDATRGPLEVGLCTRAVVGYHAVLGVHPEDVQVSPPCGAWLVPDRWTLEQACSLDVGEWPPR